MAFSQSTNNPSQAFNNGWGTVVLVSLYCLSFFIIAMIANIKHVLHHSQFAQRKTKEIEEKKETVALMQNKEEEI